MDSLCPAAGLATKLRAPLGRQQIVVQAPNGQRVTVQLPPNTRTGQRMQVTQPHGRPKPRKSSDTWPCDRSTYRTVYQHHLHLPFRAALRVVVVVAAAAATRRPPSKGLRCSNS
jgi:hypothetical protein